MPVTTRARSRQQRVSLPFPALPNNDGLSRSTTRERRPSFTDDEDETDTECRFSSTNNSQNSSPIRDGDDVVMDVHHQYRRTTVMTHTPSQESIHAVYRGHVSALKEHHAIQELTKILDKRSDTPKTDYTYARLPAYTGNYAINNRDEETQPNLCRRPISSVDYEQIDDAFDVSSSAHSSSSRIRRRDEFRVSANETSSRHARAHENGSVLDENESTTTNLTRSGPSSVPPSSTNHGIGQKFMRYFINNRDVRHHHHYHTETTNFDPGTVQERPVNREAANVFSDDEGFADAENGGADSNRISPAAESRQNGVVAGLRSRTKVRIDTSTEPIEPTAFDERNLYTSRSHRQRNGGGGTHAVARGSAARSAVPTISSAFLRFLTFLMLPIKMVSWLICAGASNVDRLARQSVFSRRGINRAGFAADGVQVADRHTFVATERETTTETETVIHHHYPPTMPQRRGLAGWFCSRWLVILLLLPFLLLLPLLCGRMYSENNMQLFPGNDLLTKPYDYVLDSARSASDLISSRARNATANIFRVFSDMRRADEAPPHINADEKDSLSISPSVTVKRPAADSLRIPVYVGSKSYTIVHNHLTPPKSPAGASSAADTHKAEIEKEKERLAILRAALAESQQLIAAEHDVLLQNIQSAIDRLEGKLTARLDGSEIVFAEYANNERKRADEHEIHATHALKEQSELDAERYRRINEAVMQLNASIHDLQSQINNRTTVDGNRSSMRTFVSELFMLERTKTQPCCLRLESQIESLRAAIGLMQSTIAELKKPLTQNYTVPHSNDRNFTQQLVENASVVTSDYVNRIAADVSTRLDQFEAQISNVQTLFEQRLQRTLEIIREETAASLLLHQERTTFIRSDVKFDNPELLKRYIDEALVRYDSDKTGEPDFALESSGGEVLSIRCTTPWHSTTVVYKIAGIPVWWRSHGDARSAIQRDMSPGNCFAFEGFPGVLVVRLAAYVRPTAVSLEHIHRSNAPSGNIDSAPKDFEVYGLRGIADLDEPQLLVRGKFDADGASVQRFPVTNLENARRDVFNMVELRVLSNHGSPSHTCVYRLRVHGVMQSKPT